MSSFPAESSYVTVSETGILTGGAIAKFMAILAGKKKVGIQLTEVEKCFT